MNVLFIGDIVGAPGRTAIEKLLPALRERERIDFVVANAENAAGGLGVTVSVAESLFALGIDVLTSGDHIWDRPDAIEALKHPKILRPANMAEGAAGNGFFVVSRSGLSLAVINLEGRVFMRHHIDCPFTAAKRIIPLLREKTPNILIDIHAEATSEKRALGWFLDGQVSVVAGTHTHVQTADEEVLPQGTAYITDVGMTGAHDSVIGRKKEKVIQSFLTGMPLRFELATEGVQLQGVLISIDETNGTARSIRRIREMLVPSA